MAAARVEQGEGFSDLGPRAQGDAPRLFLGIDIGSKTIKLAVQDGEGRLRFCSYDRHLSDVRRTLLYVTKRAAEACPDEPIGIAVTGSSGMALADALDIPFVQEVVACRLALGRLVPDADAAIEIGGEDSKILYLSGGEELRMNSTCAGGTGGFIDTLAGMLDCNAEELNFLAHGCENVHPIASRCAVFAQMDVRPLLNEGISKKDIAGSVFDAVAVQCITGLACGRPIRGVVALLGGPMHFLSSLRDRFVCRLGLAADDVRVPENGHLFVARGAAFHAALQGGRAMSMAELVRVLEEFDLDGDEGLPCMEPLFDGRDEYESFRRRHDLCKVRRTDISSYSGLAYLGVDSGSEAIKYVLVAEDGSVLHSSYMRSAGDLIEVARDVLVRLYKRMPRKHDGTPAIEIAGSVVTGYGEAYLREAFSFDASEVETFAHVRGTQEFVPEADFVLDIGGQDIKCVWLRDGRVENVVLNEACSSGCGALVSGMAWSMNVHLDQFVRSGLFAEKPVDLGTRCTVFMTSRVRHAQKVGASTGDISAGLAYSVVRNAVNKVIRKNAAHDLGENIVVQGGAFANDAVLRAFEKVFGCEAKRPDISACMGAYGAALLARDRGPVPGGSSLLGRRQLEKLSYRQAVSRCSGCSNACHLVATRFDVDGERRRFVVGNRCGRGAGRDGAVDAADALPDLFEVRHRLLFDRACLAENDAPRGAIGLVRALDMYETYPFWHALLTDLGFSVVLSNGSLQGAALETIPSESLCYPAKLAHGELQDLLGKGIGCVLLPYVDGVGARGDACPVVAEYALVLGDIARRSLRGSCAVASPAIDGLFDGDVTRRGGEPGPQLRVSEAAVRAIHQALAPVDSSVGLDEVRHAAQAGAAAMEEYRRAIAAENRKALRQTLEQGGRAAILAGRPYHGDPKVHHGIPALLRSYGYAVLTEDILLGEGTDESAASGAPEGAAGEAVSSVWEYPRRLLSAAAVAARHPAVDFIELTSFGCGLDAAASDKAARLLQAAGKMPTVLKIDEMNDLASVRIRIRSMLATHEGRRAGGKGPSC